MADDGRVTHLLHEWRQGDREALDQLTPIVYRALRRIAARYLRGERNGHTITPTALVSEVYARLLGQEQPDWSDRAHFFAVSARHMRQILVDHARHRKAAKRGNGLPPVTLDEGLIRGGRSDDLVALDDALSALAELDQRKARTVELHYFGGMSQKEIAEVLGVHVNTVARELRLAVAWLQREVAGSG